MKSNELQEHVFDTYVSLRYGMAIIGAVLPLLLYVVGRIHGVGLQASMSAYYWAPNGGDAPSRDWFVGCIFVVAACLYLYKGFTMAENLALNLAGVFGVAIAVVPMAWNCSDCGSFSWHGTCAVLMFCCLAYVVWFRAKDTLSLLPESTAARYRKRYRMIGLVMLLSPLTAFLMNGFLGRGKAYVFFVEAAGILAFAAYWVAKIFEFKLSAATRRAVQGELEITPEGDARPARQI